MFQDLNAFGMTMILLEGICGHIVLVMPLVARKSAPRGKNVKNGHFYKANYQESAI